MKKQNWFFMIAVMFAVMVMGAGTVLAGNLVWDGSEADDFWSTALNWSTGAIPIDGDNVQFTSATLARRTSGSMNINMSGWANGITIEVTNPGVDVGFTLAAALKLYDNGAVLAIDMDAADSNFSISGGTITVSGATTFDIDNVNSKDLTITSAIVLGGNTLVVKGQRHTILSGIVSGAGALTKQEAGTLTLNAANVYTGQTTLTLGAITLGAAGSIADASKVLLTDGTLTLGQAETISSLLTGSAGEIATNNLALTITQIDASTVTTVISGSGSLIKEGAETLTLNSVNTYTGVTTVNAGAYIL